MAGLETINDVVGQKVWTELEERLPNALDGAAKKMADTAAFFKANPISFSNNADLKQTVENINKLKDAQKEVQSVTSEVAKVQLLLAKAEKERAVAAKNLAQADLLGARAANEKARANKEAEKASNSRSAVEDRNAKKEANSLRQLQREEAQLARLTNELTNDYGLLSKAYNEASLKAKNYSLQLGANNPITLAAVAAANKMGDTLKRLDASVGQHQRNVGNYASGYNGLSMSIQQILREAPSAAVSLNTFFLAISNNLPIFFDEIRKIRVAQQAAIKESVLAAKTAEDEAVARALAAGQTNAQAKAAGKLAAAEAIATPEQLKSAAAARLVAEEAALAAGATEVQAKAAGDLAAKQALANSQAAKAPGVLAQIGKSLFSLNTLLTVGVLVLTLFGGKIIEWIKGLADAKGVLDETRMAFKILMDALKSGDVVKAAQDFSTLRINVQLAKEGLLDKERVLHQYNETIGKTTGEVKNLDEAERALGKNADAYVKMMLYKAAANLSLEEAAKSALKAEQERRKKEADFANSITEYAPSGSYGMGGYTPGSDQTTSETISAQRKRRQQEAIKAAEDAAKAQLSIAEKFQRDAAEIAKKSGFDFFSGTQDEKAKKPKADHTQEKLSRQEDKDRAARLAAEKELSDAIRDNRASLAEETIQINKRIFEDESKTLDVRMEAYAKYHEARNQQAKLNGQKELSDIVSLEAEIAKVEAEPEAKRSDADKALLLRKEGIAERRKGIEIKVNADLAQIATDAAADQLKILESASNEAIKFLESRISTLKELNSEVLTFEEEKLLERLEKRKISLQNYDRERKLLEDKSIVGSLAKERDAIQDQLKAQSLSIDAQITLEKKLHDVKVKLNDAETKLREDSAKKDIALSNEQLKVTLSSAQELTSAISSALQYRYDNQKESSEAESDAIERNLQAELDAIATSGKSKQEQEEAEIDAKGRAAAAEKKLSDERRKSQTEQAKVNKAIAIANIILTTAQAVIVAYAEGDPYTKAVRAAAAGIAGAAQLAIAIATPIPQYAEGTEFHPGGKAIVGDGGERELINDGGIRYWSPSVPTVVDLGRGASVTPESDLMQMAHVDAMRALKGIVSPEAYATEYVNSFERLTGEMGKVNSNIGHLTMVVKNKKEFKVDITPNGLRWGAKEHNARTEYLNRRIHIG